MLRLLNICIYSKTPRHCGFFADVLSDLGSSSTSDEYRSTFRSLECHPFGRMRLLAKKVPSIQFAKPSAFWDHFFLGTRAKLWLEECFVQHRRLSCYRQRTSGNKDPTRSFTYPDLTNHLQSFKNTRKAHICRVDSILQTDLQASASKTFLSRLKLKKCETMRENRISTSEGPDAHCRNKKNTLLQFGIEDQRYPVKIWLSKQRDSPRGEWIT